LSLQALICFQWIKICTVYELLDVLKILFPWVVLLISSKMFKMLVIKSCLMMSPINLIVFDSIIFISCFFSPTSFNIAFLVYNFVHCSCFAAICQHILNKCFNNILHMTMLRGEKLIFIVESLPFWIYSSFEIDL